MSSVLTVSSESTEITTYESNSGSQSIFDLHFRLHSIRSVESRSRGRLLSRGAAVTLVGAQMSEAAPTLLTAVGCGPAVNPLVGVQVSQFFKAPSALRTCVWTLTSVHPLVSLES